MLFRKHHRGERVEIGHDGQLHQEALGCSAACVDRYGIECKEIVDAVFTMIVSPEPLYICTTCTSVHVEIAAPQFCAISGVHEESARGEARF